jgi:predicted enzyme related to lactoylglutathione lyase
VLPKQEVMKMGLYANISDTEDNSIGLGRHQEIDIFPE